MTRLPSVLSQRDLPPAELCATRLDGEVFALDHCFCPIDVIDSAVTRAQAVAAIAPERSIAEQHTAAWIWGALDDPPVTHELCVSITARVRPAPIARMSVREVVIDDDEFEVIGGMPVTTRLRTAVDLARFCRDFGRAEIRIVSRLMTVGRFARTDCLEHINRRRNLPRKKLAAERLLACDGPAFSAEGSDLSRS